MLHHSLFTDFLCKNGMQTDKDDECTKDIICIDFQFGLRSYEEEIEHLKYLKASADGIEDEDKKEKVLEKVRYLQKKTEERRDLYRKMTKEEIREELYVNGATIIYTWKNRKTKEINSESIHYKMLYRNPSKAKEGSCMFIREELYDIAHDWMTMGLSSKMSYDNAKIVEMSAYAPLSASAIEGSITLTPEEVVILEDKDSFFRTIADVVKSAEYQTTERVLDEKKYQETGKRRFIKRPCIKRRCVIERMETDVKNTLWDGMALIDFPALPEGCNGMALLRNHFFKACAFKTDIQLFVMDYCLDHNYDYSTFEVTDMFGIKHLAKNVKLITTDNAIKWKKFADLMGDSPVAAYNYWIDRLAQDGFKWGIVKTDHPSKLGAVQQMSYQMINSLPCSKEEINEIARTSIDYVETLKQDDEEFVKYLRQNASAVNHYEMLADLYDRNHDFKYSDLWRTDKSKIIMQYVNYLRKGKITLNGDNLTVCGNPYALLLHFIGRYEGFDPTLGPDESNAIQVYTTRFDDGEFLCGIRSPNNSSNNLGYFHNHKHPLMGRYFLFSPNIMAVNCIHTDVQARMNGEDFDSDFNFVTNQPQVVLAAKRAYENFPTVVNALEESGITYKNELFEYARMDSKMQDSQKAIGGSSDSAQLALSYYWTKLERGEYDYDLDELYEDINVLAVVAQCSIDGCKRSYAVDPIEEIKRIRGQKCMTRKKDYPKFMKYTKDVPVMKNKVERPYSEISADRKKILKRIDNSLICPMNWLEDSLDKIQGMPRVSHVPNEDYFIWESGNANSRKMGKVRTLVESFDNWVKANSGAISNGDPEIQEQMVMRCNDVVENIKGMNLSYITVNHLVSSALDVGRYTLSTDNDGKEVIKITRKILNMLYRANKDSFLRCFRAQEN